MSKNKVHIDMTFNEEFSDISVQVFATIEAIFVPRLDRKTHYKTKDPAERNSK